MADRALFQTSATRAEWDEKRKRWQSLWFSAVMLTAG